MLRALRTARVWTQEEAARQANVSDRLIRKAESGGRVQLETVAVLASLYSSSQRQISPAELIEASSIAAASELVDAANVLRRWMDEVWNNGNLASLNELASASLRFKCESGVVTSRLELHERYRRIQQRYCEIECRIDRITSSNGIAVCRWEMSMRPASPSAVDLFPERKITVQGSTSIEVKLGRVVEGCEFWHPHHSYQAIVKR